MLRFFSRRKPKGRKDQRYGSGGYSNVANGTSRRPLGPTSKHKLLECKVIFLDGEDETFHIEVSYYNKIQFTVYNNNVSYLVANLWLILVQTIAELEQKFILFTFRT